MVHKTIRQLEKGDLQKGLLETLANLSPTDGLTLEHANAIFEDIRSNPRHIVFVAESEGQIVGTVTLLIEPKFTRGGRYVAHIEDVATREGWENKGISTSLLKTAIDRARHERCRKIILNCSDPNVSFYTRLDFDATGEVEMRLDLVPSTLV